MIYSSVYKRCISFSLVQDLHSQASIHPVVKLSVMYYYYSETVGSSISTGLLDCRYLTT